MVLTCGNDPHKNIVCYKGREEVFITYEPSNLQGNVHKRQIQREIGYEETSS